MAIRDEFAPGIPSSRAVQPIPTFQDPRHWKLVVQHHPAARRGDHWDIRIIDPATGHAHSWATTRASSSYFPQPGQHQPVIQQPTHTREYAESFEGEITTRYGKTRPGERVRKVFEAPIEVLQGDPNLLRFNVYKGKTAEEYVLARSKGSLGWRLMNVTKTKESLPLALPFSKPKYKAKAPGAIDLDDSNQVMAAKLDGGHNTFVLHAGKRPRVFSYREPKERTTGAIEHSQKLEELYHARTPRALNNTILRGEVYARDPSGQRPVGSEIVGGMLNAGVLKSRELQQRHGHLRPAVFDVVSFKGRDMSNAGYDEKLEALREVQRQMPVFEVPDMAFTREEKEKLLGAIKDKSHPATHEGVILWHRHEAGRPIKAKFTEDHDVFVRGFLPEKESKTGLLKDQTGKIQYSHTPDGPIVGTFSGFPRVLKKDMHHRPEVYRGAIARVTAEKKSKKGALVKPRFAGWHPDKQDETFWEKNPVHKTAGITHSEELLKLAIGAELAIAGAGAQRVGLSRVGQHLTHASKAIPGAIERALLHEPAWQPRALKGRHIFPKKVVHRVAQTIAHEPALGAVIAIPTTPLGPAAYLGARELAGRAVGLKGMGKPLSSVAKAANVSKVAIGPISAGILHRAGFPVAAQRAQAMGEKKVDVIRRALLHEPRMQPKVLQGRHILPKKLVHGLAQQVAEHPEAAPLLLAGPPGSAFAYLGGKKLLQRVVTPKVVHADAPKEAGLKAFVSREKKKALDRADDLFASDTKDRWDRFLGHAQRKSFVRALEKDPRADDKLKRHVDQMNRLLSGKVVGQVQGSGDKTYSIVRKRGGGLACTCPDWRYKRSVSPSGEQDCKHIQEFKKTEKKAQRLDPETEQRLLSGLVGAAGGGRAGGLSGAAVGGIAAATTGKNLVITPRQMGTLSGRLVSKPQKKEAATPRIALSMMDSKNPALRRLGHLYAQGASSKTLQRLTADTAEAALHGAPFGPKFFANTVQGRLAQAALEQALPKTKAGRRTAATLTWAKRNYPGATLAAGFVPKLIK